MVSNASSTEEVRTGRSVSSGTARSMCEFHARPGYIVRLFVQEKKDGFSVYSPGWVTPGV